MAFKITSGFSGEYDLIPAEWQNGFLGFGGKRIYEFQNDLVDPLTLALGKYLYRPKERYKTDMGSVPRTMQWLYPRWFAKDRYLNSFLIHDQSYAFKGIFVAVPGGWHWQKLTRNQADKMLRDCVLIEGGSKANANAIYIGVRIGGRFSWGKGSK